MLYIKIKTKNDSAIGVLEGVRRSVTRPDSTIIKVGGQGYIQQLTDVEHEKLVSAVEEALINKKELLTGSGTWYER